MADGFEFPRLDAAQPALGVQREHWQQVRTHIHQYEQKLLELQFDYQQKVNVVEALKLELRQTIKDSRACEEQCLKLATDTHNAYKEMQDLDRQLRSVEGDQVLLAEQLVVERQGLAADKNKYQETQAYFAEHIQAQREHISALKHTLQSALGVEDCSAAGGAAGLLHDAQQQAWEEGDQQQWQEAEAAAQPA